MATTTIKKETPANIGAVSKAGDTMTSTLQVANNIYPSFKGIRTDNGETSIYLENAAGGWALGINAWNLGADTFALGTYGNDTNWRLKIDSTGLVGLSEPLPVDSGGTGASTAAGARTNLGIDAAIAQATANAIKRLYSFEVPANGTVQLKFDTSANYSFLLASTGMSRADSVGVLYYINGYVTASRGVAISLGNSSIITVDMTADSKTIGIANPKLSSITLTVIPLDGESYNYRI